jgi:hypothetical protein
MAVVLDEPATTHQSASKSVAGERPAPLNLTHQGQPATLSLSRYKSASAVVSEHGAGDLAERPAPLNFLHEGQPAKLDLSRYQSAPVSTPEPSPPTESPRVRPEMPSLTHMGHPVQFILPTATEVRRTGLEMPTFTHNGQRATLDLPALHTPERQQIDRAQAREAWVGEQQGMASSAVCASSERPRLLGRSGMSGLGEMLSRGGAQLSTYLVRQADSEPQEDRVADTSRNSLSPR